MITLFDEISGGRPEHVAKGALAFLLRNSPSTCAELARQLEISSDVAQVETEYPHTWRVDIAVTWRDLSVGMSFLELKLGAPFTRLQWKAMHEMIVVAPKGTGYAAYAQTVDLEDLASASKSDSNASVIAARLLLQQACEAYGWCREVISAETIVQELRSMFVDRRAPGRNWAELYRFLYQVDCHLRDGFTAIGRSYDADERMRAPHQSGRHYGYYFSSRRRGPRMWWIGFEYPDGALPSLSLYHGEDRRGQDFLAAQPPSLRAADVAGTVIDAVVADG